MIPLAGNNGGKMIKKLILFLSAMYGFLFADVTATVTSLEDDGAGNVSIVASLETADAIAGFQFNLISDNDVLTVSSGAAGEITPGDWMISVGGGTVMGFSLMGTTIDASSNGGFVTMEATYDVANLGQTVSIWAEEEGPGGNRLLFSSVQGGPLVCSWAPVSWEVGTSGVNSLGMDSNNINSFSLSANYPNPFNPTTNISYSVPEYGDVSLVVYNALGREVNTLISSIYAPGNYTVVWNGMDDNGNEVSTGMYFYKLTSGDLTQTRKMLFVK